MDGQLNKAKVSSRASYSSAVRKVMGLVFLGMMIWSIRNYYKLVKGIPDEIICRICIYKNHPVP